MVVSATRHARIISLMDEAATIHDEREAWLEANPDHPLFPYMTLQPVETYALGLFYRGPRERAEWCAECGGTLKPDDPVFRRSVGLHGNVGPVCESCRCPGYDNHADQNGVCNSYYIDYGPCVGCGRTVHNGSNRWRRWDYCSSRCLGNFKRETQALKMAQRRFDCESCGDEYEPKRSDARYCSPRCRQMAYRNRKT